MILALKDMYWSLLSIDTKKYHTLLKPLYLHIHDTHLVKDFTLNWSVCDEGAVPSTCMLILLAENEILMMDFNYVS